jgi:hypothetical protein
MRYTKAKSELVRNLIRGASWKDRVHREYVDDLIEIERYVLTGPTGFADALRAGMLKAKYSRESMIIFKELKPEEYERFIKEDKRRRRKIREKTERLARERKIEEERLRREWLKMGGTE